MYKWGSEDWVVQITKTKSGRAGSWTLPSLFSVLSPFFPKAFLRYYQQHKCCLRAEVKGWLSTFGDYKQGRITVLPRSALRFRLVQVGSPKEFLEWWNTHLQGWVLSMWRCTWKSRLEPHCGALNCQYWIWNLYDLPRGAPLAIWY